MLTIAYDYYSASMKNQIDPDLVFKLPTMFNNK